MLEENSTSSNDLRRNTLRGSNLPFTSFYTPRTRIKGSLSAGFKGRGPHLKMQSSVELSRSRELEASRLTTLQRFYQRGGDGETFLRGF